MSDKLIDKLEKAIQTLAKGVEKVGHESLDAALQAMFYNSLGYCMLVGAFLAAYAGFVAMVWKVPDEHEAEKGPQIVVTTFATLVVLGSVLREQRLGGRR